MNKGLYESCSRGFIKNTTTLHCIPCDKGKYQIGSICEPCDAGTYGADEGLSECSTCPSGTYSTATGATSNDTCKECPIETYNSFPGATVCNACPAGQQCNSVGLKEGIECEAGTYALKRRSSVCGSCAAGRYQASKGEAQCDACPPGKFGASNGSITENDCKMCPAGKFSSSEGSSECTICSKSEYQPLEGQSSCLEFTNVGEIGGSDRLHAWKTRTLLHWRWFNSESSTNGIALYASFSITAFFVAISFLVHFKKQGYNQALQSALSSNGDAENRPLRCKRLCGHADIAADSNEIGLSGIQFR